MNLHIGIIGGGVLGLTLGYRLSQAGHKICLFEAKQQLGGLSTWFDYGDFVWDKYYHVILRQDHELLGLIDELELTNRLTWQKTSSGFLWNKQLLSISNYRDFIRFPLLNLMEKCRLGLGILYSNYLEKPEKLNGITAREWLLTIFGQKVFKTIWEPLLESKFGVLKDKIPAFILWATINRYYGTRDKTEGKEQMGYLKGGGLKSFIDALSDRIQKNGGSLSANEQVQEVEPGSTSGILLRTDKGEYKVDRLINTTPSAIFRKLNSNFGAAGASPGSAEFLGVIRLALILDQSITPYYVTNLIDKGLPYTGIIELSQIVDPMEFKNQTMVMIPRYDLPSSEWFQKPEEEIKALFMGSLKKTWPLIDKQVIRSFVAKEKIVQAIWLQGMPPTDPWISEDGRIWSINSELSGFDSLNNNGIVRIANRFSKQILEREKGKVR